MADPVPSAKSAGLMAEGIKKPLLGEALVKKGIVEKAGLTRALRLKSTERITIGRALIKLGLVTEEDIAHVIAETNGLEKIDPELLEVDPKAVELIPFSIADRYMIFPFKKTPDALAVAVDRPLYRQVLQNLERVSRSSIAQHIAPTGKLENAIALAYNAGSGLKTDGGSAIDMVDEMILKAIRMKASDIHLEPFENRFRLRFRVDGMLQEMEAFSKDQLSAVVSRIKVMAGLNIAEKRAPQDGSISFKQERVSMDIRVSSLPSIHGEKIVLRLLAGQGSQLKMDQIGLSEKDYMAFNRMINRPYGILLIVGPTGSGKSTTLSAALNSINQPDINITTVEEPVEYKIDGITQVHVGQSDKIGFATALRSILRQDPDVIMVGETRDAETADISLRAALTGHLVFTTLHTNDAPSAMPRLVDMGCEPFLVSSSVSGVLAQRLVRVLCERCKTPYDPKPRQCRSAGLAPAEVKGPWYKKKGCPVCHGTGFRGRTGIFELLEVNDTIRQAIMNNEPAEALKKYARQNNMTTLREDGVRKVNNGRTSLEELFRVTISD